MKEKKRNYIRIVGILFLLSIVFLGMANAREVKAETNAVKVVYIDYDEAKLVIDPNGNNKVYYSDSKKSTWSLAEGPKGSYVVGNKTWDNCFMMDISWISATKEYELNLKGDVNESVVNIVLPARNSKLKVKFDKLSGTFIFSNEEGATTFVWKKETSTSWSEETFIDQSGNMEKDTTKKFLNEVEKMRVKGGRMYVKLSQVPGTGAESVGARSSKEVKVTIAKRSNAPTVKIDGTKLIVNSRDTMEYMVITGGTDSNAADAALGKGSWKSASKNMKLSDFASKALYSSTNQNPQRVSVAFRIAATEKKGYSKTYFVDIPAQAARPSGSYFLAENSTEATLTMNATKLHPMQYVIVAPSDVGNFNPVTAKWKNVTNTKAVKIKAKKFPANSVIFVRDKFIKQSATTSFALPSYYEKVTLTYGAKKS